MSKYDVGDAATLTCTFKNAAGIPTDPTAITVRVKAPSAAAVSYVHGTDEEVTRVSEGMYAITLTWTEGQRWMVMFTGTGDVVASETAFVDVVRAPF
jgi:hypothetical protein